MVPRSAFILAALLLAGCAQEKTPVVSAPAAAPLGKGWTRYDSKSDGFALDLPAGIQPIDAEAPEFQQLMADMGKANPELAREIEQATSSKMFALYAMDLTQVKRRAKFVDNVNVIHRPGVGAPPMTQESIDQMSKAMKSQWKMMTIKEGEIVDLPTGKAIRMVMEIPIKKPNGETVISRSEGYYLGSGKDTFIVTYASGDDKRSGDFRKSIESFRAKS